MANRSAEAQASEAHARNARRSRQRGTTMVEFAYVFVVLFVLVFGIVDFGLYVYSAHFVANAAREAARYASVRGALCGGSVTPCPASQGAMQAALQTYVVTITPAGINPGNVTVLMPNNLGDSNPSNMPVCGSTWNYPGCTIEVQVQYGFNFLFPVNFYNLFPVGYNPGALNVTGTSTVVFSR